MVKYYFLYVYLITWTFIEDQVFLGVFITSHPRIYTYVCAELRTMQRVIEAAGLFLFLLASRHFHVHFKHKYLLYCVNIYPNTTYNTPKWLDKGVLSGNHIGFIIFHIVLLPSAKIGADEFILLLESTLLFIMTTSDSLSYFSAF